MSVAAGMDNLVSFAYRYSHGWTDWITHRVVSAIIHGVIYGFILKLMRQMTISEALVLVAVVLAGLFLWSRSRDRRGW